MSEPRSRVLSAVLQLPPALAVIPLALMMWASFQARVAYSFDIEWMEGGMLAHVWRLREGLGIYTEPSAEWVPYIYPPLYPWLLSLLGEPSYATARTVSFIATCLAAAAAVFAVRRERVGWGFAAAAAGLFFSAYDDTGSFFDLVRNDALAVCLGAWAMALSRVGTRPAVIAGGLLLFGAFTAKHNYAAVGLPILLWLWRYRGWRIAAAFAAASVLPALTFLAGMQIATEGRFLVYLLQVPAGHPLVGIRGWPIAEVELWRYAPWINAAAAVSALAMLHNKHASPRARGLLIAGVIGAALLAAMAFAADVLELRLTQPQINARAIASAVVAVPTFGALLGAFYSSKRWEGARYWVGIALVIVPLVGLMRAHHGGFINVSIPGYWLMSVLSCALIGAAARHHIALMGLLSVLVAGQLLDARWEEPERWLPTAEDAAAGQQVLEAIRSYEGEVLMPHFPWYPAMVGKRPSFPLIAYWDIDHQRGPYKEYGRSLDAALAAKQWDAVITPTKPIKHGLQKHYKKEKRVGLKGAAMRTRTGWRVQPLWIWEPKPAEE